MKVAIAGAGNVGTYIASDLKAAGHEVLVIEQNPDLVARLRPTIDVDWYIADACEVQSLHDAGLADADVVVAATGDDEDNLVISLLSKQEFAVPRVVARVNHPDNQWLWGWLTRATTRGTANSCLASREMTRLSSSSPVAATTTSTADNPTWCSSDTSQASATNHFTSRVGRSSATRSGSCSIMVTS